MGEAEGRVGETLTVSSAFELVVGCAGALLIGTLRANGFDDGRILQVCSVRFLAGTHRVKILTQQSK